MDINGTVGTTTINYKPVVDSHAHPPVQKAVTFEAAAGAFPAGEILAFDASGYAVSYDPDGASPVTIPVGVLTSPVDASGTADVLGSMLWHGAAKKSLLLVGGVAAEATDVAALENTGRIFTV